MNESEKTWQPSPEPGVYPDIAEAEYHSWDAMSASRIWDFMATSPLQFQYHSKFPQLPSQQQAFGRAVHALILEPFDFAERFAVAPTVDRRTKAGKEKWAEFDALSAEREVLKAEDYQTARAMAHAVAQHPDAKQFLSNGRAELSIVWDDADTGVRLKARLDYWRPPAIVDYKTAANASPAGFVKAIWNYGYHVQAALYRDGARAALGEPEPEFVFIAQEKQPPYDMIVRPAGESVLVGGRLAYKRALYDYKRCVETGDWPGYERTFEPLELPAWATAALGLEDESGVWK